jgi:peptidoglycan/LPS O-acetylase OafA/YrhL
MIVGMVLYAGLQAMSKPTLLRWIGGAMTAMIVGLLAYRFVEEPARRWLRGKPRAALTAS